MILGRIPRNHENWRAISPRVPQAPLQEKENAPSFCNSANSIVGCEHYADFGTNSFVLKKVLQGS
ncbi:hypothetical protein EBR03_02175, partial [bacterium]|nr:hypothetical protein [bacterium]